MYVLGGHQPQGMSYSSHVVSKLLLFRDSTQPLMKLHGLVVEVNELLLVILALKLVQGKPGLYQGGADSCLLESKEGLQ